MQTKWESAMGKVPAAKADQRARFLSRLFARPVLWRMFMRQGIDPAESWWRGAEGLMDRVLARCLGCTHGDECHAWLARAPLRSSPPEFCRNRNTLMACRNLEQAVALPNTVSEPEPSLAEATSDPIVRRLMVADGVSEAALRQTIRDKANS
jgi:hypothetical protein